MRQSKVREVHFVEIDEKVGWAGKLAREEEEEMNTTKIKRKLASWGFGNPLNQLVYTAKEIEEGKKRGEVFDPIQKTYERGYSSGYARGRRYSEKVLSTRDIRFKRAAELWCEWNRKELDASDFASKFGNLFKHECLEEWRKKPK